mmetsp:Transcript_15263/g.38688  ORF Transcript_15263/g.38688 Transcript_15263/m.38688 type:complete len:304 (-) Transcript_15263:4714-5625(-)
MARDWAGVGAGSTSGHMPSATTFSCSTLGAAAAARFLIMSMSIIDSSASSSPLLSESNIRMIESTSFPPSTPSRDAICPPADEVSACFRPSRETVAVPAATLVPPRPSESSPFLSCFLTWSMALSSVESALSTLKRLASPLRRMIASGSAPSSPFFRLFSLTTLNASVTIVMKMLTKTKKMMMIKSMKKRGPNTGEISWNCEKSKTPITISHSVTKLVPKSMQLSSCDEKAMVKACVNARKMNRKRTTKEASSSAAMVMVELSTDKLGEMVTYLNTLMKESRQLIAVNHWIVYLASPTEKKST